MWGFKSAQLLLGVLNMKTAGIVVGTDIFKIKEEMTEKMKLKVAKLRVVMAIFPRKDTFLDTLYT